MYDLFKQPLMYYVLRPVVRRLPPVAWIAAARLAAGLGAPWTVLRRRAALSAVLRACGRRDTVATRLRLAAAALYLRLRKLDFYTERKPRDIQIVWDGESPAAQPCCLVVLDTFGAEYVMTPLNTFDALVVRRTFGGEGVLHPSTASAAQCWTAHCAWLRWKALASRTIDVGVSTLQLRKLIKLRRNMIVFQGNLDPAPNRPRIALLGHAVPMPLGAVRLARLSGLPMRFMRIQPTAIGWEIRIDAPMPADETALIARIEYELRKCPEAWTLWPLFFDHAEPLPSGNNRGQAEACDSSVPDRDSAPSPAV